MCIRDSLQAMLAPDPGTGNQLPQELAPILQKLVNTYTSAMTAKGTFDAVKACLLYTSRCV